MLLISHRGNTKGPLSCIENHPSSILEAINLGYHCEIDVWKINEKFYLGHDLPIFLIEREFLLTPNLWIHCKNFESLENLKDIDNNIFFHNKDDYTLTSKGIIWTYPNMKVGQNSVIVSYDQSNIYTNIYGVCSDYVSLICTK